MPRIASAVVFALALSGLALFSGCGGGGGSEKPGARVTDPSRVPSSTPVQNPTLYKIQGNEVLISGGASGQITPAAQTTPVASDYVIKAGDFCATIASDHKITLDDFLKANRNVDCNNLKIGDKVKIPSSAAATPTKPSIGGTPASGGSGGAKTYVVQPGDTCGAIATAKGVSLQALLSANPSINSNCSNLNAGQTINIP
jgi:LysM repeat protein